MNRVSKKFVAVLFVLMTFMGSIFAQDAVTRALDLINKSLILNDYDRAYSYAKFVINYYDGEEIPSDVVSVVKEAISERGDYLVQAGKWDAVLVMEGELKNAPANVKSALDSSLTKTRNHYKQVEEEKEKQKKEAEKKAEEERIRLQQQKLLEEQAKAKAEQEAETKRLLELYEQQRKQDAERQESEKKLAEQKEAELKKQIAEKEELQRKEDKAREEELRLAEIERQNKIRLEDIEREKLSEERQLEMEKSRQESDAQYRQEMSQMLAEMNRASNDTINDVTKNNKIIMLVFGFIILLFIGVIVGIVFIVMRQQKIHQNQLKETIMTMQAQAMKHANSVSETIPLLLQMQTLSLAANSLDRQNSVLALGDDSNGPKDEKAEMTALISECRRYGKQIDEATGRKNVSTRVADLVLKISQQMGYAEFDCILYYAAALVYDIGFLSVNNSILKSGTLTEAQFAEVKTHAAIGEKMLFFVDIRYRPIFIDAAGKHHENLDGTGYPLGLKDEDIPYIARVIRVAESYIALVSNRSYKTIMDRDAAIAELRNSIGRYDQEIVDALDAII